MDQHDERDKRDGTHEVTPRDDQGLEGDPQSPGDPTAADASVQDYLDALPREQLDGDVYPAIRQRLRDRARPRQAGLTVTLEIVIAVSLLVFIAAFALLGRSGGDAPAPACSAGDLQALARTTPGLVVAPRTDGTSALTVPEPATVPAITKKIQAQGCSVSATTRHDDGSTTLVVRQASELR